MKNFKLAAVASIVIASTSGVALAATQGNLDTTSEGTSDVTIIKQNAVQLTKVDDLDFGNVGFMASDTTLSDDVCVFSSTTDYNVTMSSGQGPGAFAVADGGNSIPYTVSWTDGTTTATDPVVSGTQIADDFTGDDADPDCGGGTNASFSVTIGAAGFNAAPTGSYSDTLTLLVEPL